MLNISRDMASRQGLNQDFAYEAVVIDNDDPEHLCRVRARVPLLFNGIEDKHLPWAIPSFAHGDGAGPGSGTAYVPKKGTKVVLRFQEGKETSPTWEGYPVDKKSKLQEMEHNYPDRKVFRMQNKALIVIDTRSNELFLRNPGDTRIYIDGNVELTVNGNVTESITGNRSTFVKGDSLEVIRGNRTTFVTGNSIEAIGGDLTQTVTGAVNYGVKGSSTIVIKGNSNRSVTGNSISLVSGNSLDSTVGNSSKVTGGNGLISVSGTDSYQVGGTHSRNAGTIFDNGAAPSPVTPSNAQAPAEPQATPETPDLSKWTGIDGGAVGVVVPTK